MQGETPSERAHDFCWVLTAGLPAAANSHGQWRCAQGKSHEVVPKLKQDMMPILKTNWKVWIPFQIFNFNFVPVQLQARWPTRAS